MANGSEKRSESLFVEITSPGKPSVLRIREGTSARIGRELDNEIVIDDPFVSRHHVEIKAAGRRAIVKDLETRNGTLHRGVRISEITIDDEAMLLLGRHVSVRITVGDETRPHVVAGSGLVGGSAVMEKLRNHVSKVAPTDLTVLIEGETGTGKEVVAQAIHSASGRSRNNFVVFDCGSVSPTLLAAELFGHTKGAFTGAAGATEGAFRRAQRGTLFLDEIGELPLDLQPALLRALEAREVKPVGGDAYMPIDVRVVAATNRSLEDEVAAGRFRRDLLFRLAVARVKLPPLRARTEDIPSLAQHFAARLGSMLAPDVIAQLEKRAWPGNVRELRNVVETAVLMTGPGQLVTSLGDEGYVESDDNVTLPQTSAMRAAASAAANATIAPPPVVIQPGVSFQDAKQAAVDAFEKEYLLKLFIDSDYNLSEASRRSGVDRGYLRELYRKHGLDPAQLRAQKKPEK
jgi:transcriptional regulator with GAF, ATPase, and Fis domain